MAARDAQVIELVSAEHAERTRRRRASDDADLFELLDQVVDPEIPVLSLWDLGVLQDIRRDGAGVQVTITPTYSGCPAIEAMRDAIRRCLTEAGFDQLRIELQLAPAWTTDWMSPAARERLRNYGIAPPDDLRCPQCGSGNFELLSEFGSTACKALYRCLDCAEPFDHFKSI